MSLVKKISKKALLATITNTTNFCYTVIIWFRIIYIVVIIEIINFFIIIKIRCYFYFRVIFCLNVKRTNGPLSSTVATFSLLLDQIISFAKPNASYSICALFFYYTDFFCLKYRPGSCCSLECCSLLTSSLSVISLGGSS